MKLKGARRAAALLFAVMTVSLCGCMRPASEVYLEPSYSRDSIVFAMLDALEDGRAQVRVHVPLELSLTLDSMELDALFATAHYNDAADLPIYPSSRTRQCVNNRNGGYTATFTLSYGDISNLEYNSCRRRYARQLDEYAAELAKLNEPPAKLYRTIYFLVCQHTQYDSALAERISAGEQDIFSAASLEARGSYGALVERSSICTGYAMLYKALCDRMGLECWVVFGEAQGVTHAWNLVIVDGEIRYIDAANGDRDTEPNADFCLISPVRFATLEREASQEIYIPQRFVEAGYRS